MKLSTPTCGQRDLATFFVVFIPTRKFLLEFKLPNLPIFQDLTLFLYQIFLHTLHEVPIDITKNTLRLPRCLINYAVKSN